MGRTWDAYGFTVPPTPASTGSRSHRATPDESASTGSVRHPSYRRKNLYNNINIRHANTQLPGYVSSHIEALRAERDSPGPLSEQIDGYLDRLETLQRGCTEADVEELFKDTVFPKNSDPTYGHLTGLESSRSSLMASHLVPNNPESPFRVSQPKPDLLYGYSGDPGDGAFTQSQFLAQASLHPQNARFAEATTQGLRFPFFPIEFKAAGGTQGDLWVATNQCAAPTGPRRNAFESKPEVLPTSFPFLSAAFPSLVHVQLPQSFLAIHVDVIAVFVDPGVVEVPFPSIVCRCWYQSLP
jgi:hypothetical protein